MIRLLIMILVVLQLLSCKSNSYTFLNKGEIIRGKIIDEETGEVMIGETIYEYDNKMNRTLTDLEGHFKLKFDSIYPFVVIPQCFTEYIFEVQSKENTLIVSYGKQARKLTRRNKRKLLNKRIN